MGIVNTTSDSFYDGGRVELDDALAHALTLVEEGADLLDVGAVKAGPGPEVGEDEETFRLIPLVDALARACDVPISVETARPDVARAALDAGAAIVNDVTAFTDSEMLRVCARGGAGVILVHNGGQIHGRPRHPRYEDVVDDVITTWHSLAARARAAGVADDALVMDNGLDFGKTTFHSLELVKRLPEQVTLGRPVMVAPSRKDIVGEVLDAPPSERLEGTLALVSLSAYLGASIVRVHDVAACAASVRQVEAVTGGFPPRAPIRGLWD